jgi:hypothetical protein
MQSEKVAEKNKKKQIGAATAVRHHTCAFIEQTFIPAYGFLVGKQQSNAPYISSNAPYVEISCVSPNVSLQRSQVTRVTMSKWFSTTVTGHRCDHVSFLPSGSIKRQ